MSAAKSNKEQPAKPTTQAKTRKILRMEFLPFVSRQ